jgi:hypothetical protein
MESAHEEIKDEYILEVSASLFSSKLLLLLLLLLTITS